jgi:histidinol phosphatase-like enzyme
MMNDLDIKNKRILLFDFDGTLIETASGNTFATDLTDMRIKMDVVNKALDLMQENGVKVFAIVSNQGGVEAGFVSGADIEAKIEKVCAYNSGINYMDITTFLDKDLDLEYVLSKEHTSEGIVILNNDHIYP